jgi:hypothetical protein
MADNLVYEESLNTEIDTSEFISKRYVYVNDNNNGNYTSQIVIDSTPLSNAGGWINWSEGFIVLPLLVQLTCSSANFATTLPVDSSVSDYAWAFKNGFWNLINSMTVEFNNQNVVQQTPFLNVFRSFKCLTSWSVDDLENHGASCGFCPDSADSWSFTKDFTTATAGNYAGNGQNVPLTNNRNCSVRGSSLTGASTGIANLVPNQDFVPQSDVVGLPTTTNTSYTYSGVNNQTTATNSYLYTPNTYNAGMRKRQADVLYDTASAGSLGQSGLNTASSCETVFRSSKIAEAGCHTWRVYAKLRLKDLADLFEKCPLLKGSTMRFYINTNQSIVDFTSTRAVLNADTSAITTASVLAPTAVNVVGGLTNPLMLASNLLGQGGSAIPAPIGTVSDTFQLSVSIFKNNFTQANKTSQQTALTSCRLYAPVYTMNPIAESKYLSLAPTKRIKYNDIFQYQFNNVGTGSFNFLVSNGINHIQSVLVVPFISQSNSYTNPAGTVVNALTFNQQQNPCSPSPSMPDPIMLTNFNILVSGVNLFLNNENYDFEAFAQQLAQSNQLNGGLTTGLSSGLISERMFSQAYRYYYGNASRILPSEEGVSRSVQIVGQNVSSYSCDFMVFVEFQREMVIDVATGARIE